MFPFASPMKIPPPFPAWHVGQSRPAKKHQQTNLKKVGEHVVVPKRMPEYSCIVVFAYYLHLFL